MTTNATAIRDAAFTRAQAAGTWQTARKTDLPTLAGVDLPALQVFLLSEKMAPDGDADVSVPRFISDVTIGISVARGFDDPVVTDGAIDGDADAILNALLCDPTFVCGPPQESLFEAVTAINRRRIFSKEGETYFIELRLELTFQYRLYFEPLAPNWLEEIDLTAFPGSVTADGVTVALEVGELRFSVTGPASGAHAVASQPFTAMLEAGASFTGNQSVTISDGAGGGSIAPSIGSPAVGAVTVTPPNGATSFTFTYTPASAGAKSISFGNAQNWSNPTALVYTAT